MTLYLPRATTPAVLPVGLASSRSALPVVGRVLVVEDDPAAADSVVASLQRLGYETRAVDRAGKALEILARDGRFDLVLSDIVMPELNGVELAGALARLHPGTDLLTTGYDPLPLDIDLRGAEILKKPYDLDTLKLAINSCLARRAGNIAS